MPASSTTGQILSRARTEAEAVELLVSAGRPRADAEEIAAIAFGSSQGDVLGNNRRKWASTQAAGLIGSAGAGR